MGDVGYFSFSFFFFSLNGFFFFFVLTAFCCKDWKVSPSKHRVGLGMVVLKVLRGRGVFYVFCFVFFV